MQKLARALAFLLPLALVGASVAQELRPSPDADPLLHTPVTNLHPGATPNPPELKNPLADDPQAATRGMRDFVSLNCVGCHAPNGGGGMGPSLSNNRWIYGGEPAQIFLTIYQGRPKGMPAWGRSLPEKTIWELVAYVKSLSQPGDGAFGYTLSDAERQPAEQQVPAEFQTTVTPWAFTEPFTSGQPPKGN